jgi:hypothetical protein
MTVLLNFAHVRKGIVLAHDRQYHSLYDITLRTAQTAIAAAWARAAASATAGAAAAAAGAAAV